MIKYASNAFLALKISFINEIANICSATGADVVQVAAGMGLDPRISPHFLRAGIGFGGSCLPKDTRALLHIALQHGYHAELLEAVLRVNERQWRRVLVLLEEALGGLADRTVSVLGLAFKAGTNDVRDSLGVKLVAELLRKGATVRAYDPLVRGLVQSHPKYQQMLDLTGALVGADAVIITTEEPEFARLTPNVVETLMRTPVVVDGRNILPWIPGDVGNVQYYGIGRGTLPHLPVRTEAI